MGDKKFEGYLSKVWTSLDRFKTLALDDWREIRKLLEIYFRTRITINPLFDEITHISLDQGLVEDFINEPGRWGGSTLSSKNGIDLNTASPWWWKALVDGWELEAFVWTIGVEKLSKPLESISGGWKTLP